MNQSAWEALVRYYSRVSKKFDRSKKESAFRQNVESVIEAIPVQDREVILNHWRINNEAIHPFQGTSHPSPLIIVESNFTSNSATDRASGMVGSKGCAFVFEAKLVHTAPGEVVQAVIAHELAHAWIFAKYHSNRIPLPELTGSSARKLEEYRTEAHHEEWLVDEIVERWGYNQHLLEFWEIAVEDCPSNPSGYYAMLKRRVANAPGGTVQHRTVIHLADGVPL